MTKDKLEKIIILKKQMLKHKNKFAGDNQINGFDLNKANLEMLEGIYEQMCLKEPTGKSETEQKDINELLETLGILKDLNELFKKGGK